MVVAQWLEHQPTNLDIIDLNPARCLAFFFYIGLSFILTENVLNQEMHVNKDSLLIVAKQAKKEKNR